jgi:hypothetical protein
LEAGYEAFELRIGDCERSIRVETFTPRGESLTQPLWADLEVDELPTAARLDREALVAVSCRALPVDAVAPKALPDLLRR